ncbi:MAG: tetratricopeptide repeat protein [Bdellovibrionales bacterium]|nr:tetratricopeptide repeat protein [Bdellovibrionales bacterium]
MTSNKDSKNNNISSEKILDFIVKNKNSLLGGLFAFIAILIGYGVFNNIKTEANKEAANAFYTIEKQYEAMVKPEAPKADVEQEAQAPEPKKLTEEQASQLLAKFDEVYKVHSGTPQAGFALLDMVYILKDNGFIQKAIELSEQKLEGLNKESMPYAMGLLQLGSLQMESENYEKAAANFEKVEKLDQVSFLKGEALIKKGLCYQAMNQLDQAKAVFTQASQEYPDSEYGASAKKYLKVLLINN